MHKWAGPFLHPVDPVALGLSDYFDVVKHPMDFSTILSQIENHELRSKDEFASKVNLVFDNALLYNSKGSDVYFPFLFILTASHIMASELQSLFAKEMETITGQIFAAGPDAQAPTYYVPSRRERAPLPDIPPKLPRVSESRPAKSSAEKARLAQKEEMEMMKSRIQQLEGELSRMTQEVNERQGKGEKALDARPMTMEEKKALSMAEQMKIPVKGVVENYSYLHYEKLKYRDESSVRIVNGRVERLIFAERDNGIEVLLIEIDDTHYGNKG